MKNNILLEKLFDNKNLSAAEMETLLNSCIRGELNDVQLAGMLIGLRMKGETIDEIIGLINGMRKHGIRFPSIADAIDTCGTGGDGRGTFNISTTVAFVAAGAGVSVIKHGNKAASSKCGSADVLSALGISLTFSPEQAKEVFDAVGMIFLFAPSYHPAMKIIGPVRQALGTRTVFNYLGPFLNPARVKRQLIGVPSIELAGKLAQVATKLNYDHLLLVANENGMDEIALNDSSILFEIRGETAKTYKVDPQNFGFKKSAFSEIKGGDAEENAGIIKRVLCGEKGAKRDIVVLNSAYALLISGKVRVITEGIKLAEESIDSGAAERVLDNLIKETKKYAA